jgi:hypothetical protein
MPAQLNRFTHLKAQLVLHGRGGEGVFFCALCLSLQGGMGEPSLTRAARLKKSVQWLAAVGVAVLGWMHRAAHRLQPQPCACGEDVAGCWTQQGRSQPCAFVICVLYINMTWPRGTSFSQLPSAVHSTVVHPIVSPSLRPRGG